MLKSIILFDGECNFCSRSVHFIMKRDSQKKFQFASLQSEVGKLLCNQYQVPKDLNSMILIDNQRYYAKSSAVLRISLGLEGFWKVFSILMIFPPILRDTVYDFIAKHRYIFGKKKSCKIPNKEDMERFL